MGGIGAQEYAAGCARVHVRGVPAGAGVRRNKDAGGERRVLGRSVPSGLISGRLCGRSERATRLQPPSRPLARW